MAGKSLGPVCVVSSSCHKVTLPPTAAAELHHQADQSAQVIFVSAAQTAVHLFKVIHHQGATRNIKWTIFSCQCSFIVASAVAWGHKYCSVKVKQRASQQWSPSSAAAAAAAAAAAPSTLMVVMVHTPSTPAPDTKDHFHAYRS